MTKLFRSIVGDESDPLWVPTSASRYAPAGSLEERYWTCLDDRYVVATTGYPGTVNSVAMTVPTGFSIGGSPITESGTLAVTNSFTAGSVVFAMGTGFAQDNTNLFWNDTDNRLGVGINSSLQARVHIKGARNDNTTNSFLVENSDGLDQFWIGNGGATTIRTDADQKFVFSSGSLNITDDAGIIRNASITANAINWNYANFTSSNLSITTNGSVSAIWDMSFTTANNGAGIATTRFLYVRPTINHSNVADFIGFHYAPTVTAIGGRHYSAVFESGDMIIGGTSANTSAAFQVDSLTKGALFPRMTSTQRDAISSPAEGLIIYNLTTHKLNLRTAASWEAITSS